MRCLTTCGLLSVTLAAFPACNKPPAPTMATPVATAPTAAAPTPTPAPAPSAPTTIAVGMPIDPADTLSSFYGLGPFGYHGADHAEDGHPGWDVEYRLGASVRAAADGTVQSVFTDAFNAARTTVQLMHSAGGPRGFRTVYTNLTDIPANIVAGAAVQRGQPIGLVGSITATQGTSPITYAITHFQLDDFSSEAGLTNRNAVSP